MAELHFLDAGFIELEDSDRRISLGIGVVAVLHGRPPDRDEFAAILRDRITVDARLRQRMRRSTWDLAAPSWEDDPAFDIEHHIRRIALPGPADESALCEVVAAELAHRLDRDHPLWRCVVVERLAGDRWALLLMVHHSVLDGMSGVGLLTRLCDMSARPESSCETADSRRVSASGARLRGLAALLRAPVDLPLAALSTVRRLVPVAIEIFSAADHSPLNGEIGQQRRYTVARAGLTEIGEIRAAFDVTVNDVVLTLVTAGYRELLLRRGERPTADMLRMLVPVSTRTADAKSVLDNRVSVLLPLLPVHVDDPVERLSVISGRMTERKAGGEAAAERTLVKWAEYLPFAPIAWAIRVLGGFPQSSVTAVATNVPGPREALFFAGRRVEELLPVVPIAVRLRTGIAVLSYAGRLTFGITGDFDTVPDLAAIVEGIEQDAAKLLEAARNR